MAYYIEDLSRSHIIQEDMDVRPLGFAERSALDLNERIQGYIIPYYDINGLPTRFYRARLQDTTAKYKQPRGSNNAVYFPKRFLQTLNGHEYVIITEGEKKATKAVREGFPCVAIGGVYSWRNNTVQLPAKNLITNQSKNGAVDLGVEHIQNIKLRLNGLDVDRMFTEYADGFEDLVKLIRERKLKVIILFDSDHRGQVNNHITIDVQKAAARLGLELRSMDIPLMHIKQLVLPLGNHEKMGLDDFLITHKPDELEKLVRDILSNPRAFPRHPFIFQYVTTKLNNAKNTRKDMSNIGLSIIADLDVRGKRLRTETDNDMHYFDADEHRLVPITGMGGPQGNAVVMYNDFQSLLYRRYGLTGADSKLMAYFTTQITSEEPIDAVRTRKGTFSLGDTVYHQINSTQYVTCNSASPIVLHNNGDGGVMFESRAVEDDLDGAQLQREVLQQLQQPLRPWWFDTLVNTRIKDDSTNRRKKLAALLYYTSPWLFRWRGTQLPVEMVTGEAGSGKSTLYSLRLRILTGREDLRNRPQTLKDWHASILETGGLHVIDNANLDSDPSLAQSISDEMCRMITEPNPTVEMRRFYTERGLMKIPAHVTFALTAIKVPFRQIDLMQRAYHINLERGTSESSYLFDADWASHQLLSKGGRVAWLAHHLIVLHKFFELVDHEWSGRYKAKYRLINFEQIVRLMAKVFNWDDSWIPEFLSGATREVTIGVDAAMQGLIAFRDEYKHMIGIGTVPCETVVNWAQQETAYHKCTPLVSVGSLKRYLQGQVATLADATRVEYLSSAGAIRLLPDRG